MAASFRFAICNEVFGKRGFADSCAATKRMGYEGIEIAPFTLAEDPAAIPQAQRAEYRKIINGEGLRFAGLHWLMAAPKGLHVTTADEETRQRSWNHVRRLTELCRDLAGEAEAERPVLVFGSPQQRAATGGMTPAEATRIFTEELARVAPEAEARKVLILVEALPRNQCNIINRLEDAVAIAGQIGSPAVRTMFDSHNAVDETEAHADLIRRYIGYVEHVHVNELDGREPGTGDYDFATLLRVLDEVRYRRWVSLEAFDFSREAEVIGGGSIAYLKRLMRI